MKTHAREYRAWQSAKTRCYNPRYHNYRHYGARGIYMSDEWRNDFEAFLGAMGQCPDGFSLDRIDNDGPYAPGNCRWAEPKQQHRNTRANRRLMLNGEELTLSEWSERLRISKTTLHQRLTHGWSVERTLTEPLTR